MVYLDHASTTTPFAEVVEAMNEWYRPDHTGNPSSIHTRGLAARKAVENARAQVARLINAEPEEIYFVSGGTEANNAWLNCFDGELVLTTEIEHDSILEVLKQRGDMRRQLATVFVPVNEDGIVNLNEFVNIINSSGDKTAVSLMWVNNELGSVNPIYEIGLLCKQYNLFYHVDAIQAAGHVSIDVKRCNIDTLSMSAHKFGGPMGIGALYINKRIKKRPWILGGGQEGGMRGGTENVPGIVGMGKAAEIVKKRCWEYKKKWRDLYCEFLGELDFTYCDWAVNGKHEDGSNIISLTFPGVNSESLLTYCDLHDVCISAGSACGAYSPGTSHVLKGVGMSEEDAACTVRLSMGYDTTTEDMIEAAHVISAGVTAIRKAGRNN